ncbi:MAG: preprotein translocase subunit SecE [Caulobacteraceae bacterium]
MAKTPGNRPTAQKTKTAPRQGGGERRRRVRGVGGGPRAQEAHQPAAIHRRSPRGGRKVTWTSRKETWITSVMVFIMVVTVVAVPVPGRLPAQPGRRRHHPVGQLRQES